jgi:outer membrane biosynthesis protein TonB
MTTQPTRPTGGPGSHAPAPFRATRTATGVRGRAVLAALGLALAAAVLPATAVHASPQPPDIDNRFANPGGNPQPPEPPDPPQWGPQDLASPTEDPEPPLPPDPPDVPDWGPDDLANPTENPEPPLPPEPPDNGPDDEANPVDNPEPPPPPNPNPTSPADNPIPTPQRIDAGFGGTAAGAHHAAGLALIGAALVLAVLLVATARRHRSGSGSAR